MHNFRKISIIFLLVLKHVLSDILLIYGENPNSYHLECIVNEEDPAIYLNNPMSDLIILKQSEFQDSILLEDFENNYNDTDHYWKIHKYPDKEYNHNLLKPIKDHRWELFETFINDLYIPFNNTVSVSMKLSTAVIVKFSLNGEIIIEGASNNTQDTASGHVCFKLYPEDKWLRLQIRPYNKTGIVVISNNEQCYHQYPTDIVYQLKNEASSTCKDEQYTYLWTNQTQAVYQISINNNTSKACILFYTTMCENCSLLIELRDQITKYLIIDEYIAVDNEYEWETKKLCYDSGLPSKLFITFITSGNNKSNRNFWAIDDIRLSSKYGKRILKYESTNNDIFSYNCESIDTKFNSSSILHNTKVTCNRRIGKYCEDYINCTACYRRNNQIECCKESKIIELTDVNIGESSSQLPITTTDTTTSTTVIATTKFNETTTILDYSTDLTRKTTTTSTEEISTPILTTTTRSNKENSKQQTKFNTNYFYLLLLIIPIVGLVGVVVYKRKKSQTSKVSQPENGRLTTPDWLYNEPEYEE